MSLSSNQLSVVSGQGNKLKPQAGVLKPLCRLLPIVCCLVLASCGFRPVYDKSSANSEKSIINTGIRVSATASGTTSTLPTSSDASADNSSATTMARQFSNNLEDMVNSGASPSYDLNVLINYSNIGVGVARDGTASRYNLVISSTYKLTRISDGKEVGNGTLSSVTSYNNPNNQYFSTYISEQDARKRGIKELAELYRHRLLSFVEKEELKK
ncbi:MAG: hypothetical protein AABY33_08535 [Pseudomonadota bacterium]